MLGTENWRTLSWEELCSNEQEREVEKNKKKEWDYETLGELTISQNEMEREFERMLLK